MSSESKLKLVKKGNPLKNKSNEQESGDTQENIQPQETQQQPQEQLIQKESKGAEEPNFLRLINQFDDLVNESANLFIETVVTKLKLRGKQVPPNINEVLYASLDDKLKLIIMFKILDNMGVTDIREVIGEDLVKNMISNVHM